MKILSRPKKNAEEYGRWAVNPYLGCTGGCLYCYLKEGPGAKNLGGNTPRLKAHVVNMEHACYLAMCEILEHRDEIIRDGGLFMTFTSDPMLPKTREVYLTIARRAIESRIPVTVLTKCTSFCKPGTPAFGYASTDRDPATAELWFCDCIEHSRRPIFSPFKDLMSQHLAFGWTLTGHDELEPNASPNADRIKAMGRLFDAGFKTWASIEPVIDFDSSLRMIQQALDAGCQHFKIGLMTRGTKVCRSGFTLGGQTFEPYDPARCLAFVQDVMTATRDRATVYWKQSFRDFIGGTPNHRLFTDGELHKIFDDYPNAVGKDWSMFNPQNK